MKKLISIVLACFLALNILPQPVWAENPKVMVLEVKDEINDGLLEYLTRNFAEAEKMGVSTIILDMDTPGGQVASATEIKKEIYAVDIPVICLVEN